MLLRDRDKKKQKKKPSTCTGHTAVVSSREGLPLQAVGKLHSVKSKLSKKGAGDL